jgi:type II secretory pathway pseudopilin PulG
MAHFKSKNKLAAYTMVEIAVVLIVVGLIMAGILVGKSVYNAGKLRSVAVDFQRYDAAVRNFREKYNALPGDIANATTIFGTTDANGYSVTNGNGNGYIGLLGASGVGTAEVRAAWQELALAGFIPGVYRGESASVAIGTTHPISAYSNMTTFWFYYGNLWGQYTATSALVFSGISSFGWDNPLLSTAEAVQLDAKIDDGMPYTGKMIGYNPTANNCVATALASSPAKTLTYLSTAPTTLCTVHYALEEGYYQ